MFILRRKTSITVDAELWRKWINFVISIHGSTRKISDEMEKALLEYMKGGSYRISAGELRRILGVETVRLDVEIPEGLERRILEYRHKRVY
ncbi:MAG: hypothetical protein ACP5OK_05660 [Thermoprotei archaeon]